MIKILHYIPGFGFGGIENVVLNLYKNIDKEIFQFDFLVETDIPEYARKIILENGGNVIQIPKMTNLSKFFKYINSLIKIFKSNKYDVFHCHSLDTRPFPMFFSKLFGTKVRIMHVHFNDFNNKKMLLIKKMFVRVGERNANYYIACSNRAANSIFSKRNRNKVLVLNNGIDIVHYNFKKSVRVEMRDKLCKDDTCLIGCIGRLSYLKNQQFALALAKKLPPNFLICFLGEGEDRSKLMNYVQNNKLNNVIFLGNVDNVEEYLDAFDLVLMPSVSEAMPLTVIELQANGVPAVVSPAIDREFIVNSNVCRLELDTSKWLDYILTTELVRQLPRKELNKFDINSVVALYEKTIVDLIDIQRRKKM